MAPRKTEINQENGRYKILMASGTPYNKRNQDTGHIQLHKPQGMVAKETSVVNVRTASVLHRPQGMVAKETD